MLAQSIIASSFIRGNSGPAIVNPSLGVPVSILVAHPNQANGFFRRDYDSGYFNDDVNWFGSHSPSYSGEDDYINIGSSLNDQNIDNYSIEWTGYFVPPSDGNYIFRTTSDDASYMWLGAEALSGFTTGNAIVNNGSTHGDATVSSSNEYTMASNTAYPMRVQYGEAGGGATMYAEFSSDGGNTWNHFINHCFRISSTPEGYLPYSSAYQVFALDGGNYSGTGPWVDSINGKSFTLYNNPTWDDTTNGGQFRFDAAQSQWGESGGPGTSLASLHSFTIQGVFKLHSLPPSEALPCLITENWPGNGIRINYAIGFLNSSSQLEAGFFDADGGFWNVLNATASPATNTWYDVVCTFDANTKYLKTYINGNFVDVTTAPGTASSDGAGIRIARRWDDAQYLDSTVKSINIWNGVLSGSEISTLHTQYNSLV